MSATMTAPPPAAAPPDPTQDAAPDGPTVACTVMDNHDGTFTVIPGDEPEEGEQGDMSGDDAAALGPDGGGPAGQPASSPAEAGKIVAQILQDGMNGGPGATDAAFAQGFGGPGAAPPMVQKFPSKGM